MSRNDQPGRVSEPTIMRRRPPVLFRILRNFIGWVLIFGVIIGGGLAWAWFSFEAPGPLAAKTVVQFPKDANRTTIATILKDKGVITSSAIFSGAAVAASYLKPVSLKPGEYEFTANVSMRDVLTMILGGQFLRYKVAVPEGLTSQMVAMRLAEQEELDGAITQLPAEGTLLPATWDAVRGDSRQKLLDQMAASQNRLMDELMPKLSADSPLKTKQDVLTLASIVEKETAVADERPIVAAVFLNRLKQGMKLQTDPSVIYGIAGGVGKLDHPLTRAELETPTPYNTYTNVGLPPGPIANPGRASIEAVLAPANVPYLFFVANGSGRHAFATTLEEHNANVKKWRAITGQADPVAPAVPKPAAGTAQQPASATGTTTPAPLPVPTGKPTAKKVPIPVPSPSPQKPKP